MRPLVGITAWRRTLDTYLGPEALQTLSTYYSDSVIAADMTPLIFPSGQDPSEAGRLVSLVDGVLRPHAAGRDVTFLVRPARAAQVVVALETLRAGPAVARVPAQPNQLARLEVCDVVADLRDGADHLMARDRRRRAAGGGR